MDEGRLQRPPFIRYLFHIKHEQNMCTKYNVNTYSKYVEVYKDIETTNGQSVIFSQQQTLLFDKKSKKKCR